LNETQDRKCYKLLYDTLQRQSNASEDDYFLLIFVDLFSYFFVVVAVVVEIHVNCHLNNVENQQTDLDYLETWQHRPQYEEEETGTAFFPPFIRFTEIIQARKQNEQNEQIISIENDRVQ